MPPRKKLKIEKTCTGCQELKPIDKKNFVYDGISGRYGFSRICVVCAKRVERVVKMILRAMGKID